MKIKKLLCAAAALCVCLTAGISVHAAPKDAAIKAYKEMLSKPTIAWTNKYTNEPTSSLKFALVDFNNDGTPELYVEKDTHSGIDARFKVFSYNGSRPVCILSRSEREELTSYYPGSSLVYIKRSDMSGIVRTYYSISSNNAKPVLSYIVPYNSPAEYYSGEYYYGTKIAKDQYTQKKKALLKNNAGNNKIYTKANTDANRKKYLTTKSLNTTLKLSKKSVTKYEGTTYSLKVSLSGYSGALKWTSSNPDIATVSSKGKVSLKKPGKATIKVSAGNLSASCKFTVKTKNTAATYRKMYKEYLPKLSSSLSYAIVNASDQKLPVLLVATLPSLKKCDVYYVKGSKVSKIGTVSAGTYIQYRNGYLYQLSHYSWIKSYVKNGTIVSKKYTDFSEYQKADPQDIKFLKNTSSNRNYI